RLQRADEYIRGRKQHQGQLLRQDEAKGVVAIDRDPRRVERRRRIPETPETEDLAAARGPRGRDSTALGVGLLGNDEDALAEVGVCHTPKSSWNATVTTSTGGSTRWVVSSIVSLALVKLRLLHRERLN